MGKGKKSGISRGGAGEKKQASRPTHFLCFPLARNDTVPIVAKSMDHFRQASMEPHRANAHDNEDKMATYSRDNVTEDDADKGKDTPDDSDPLGNVIRAAESQLTFEDGLKVLPSIAFRGAGTMHLTLGVMDLSDPAEMEKAKHLLQSLDLPKMLDDATKGPPAGMKVARKWEEKHTDGSVEGSQDVPAGTVEKSNGADSSSRSVSPSPISHLANTTHVPPIHISLTGVGAFASPKKARVIWAKPRAQTKADGPEPSGINGNSDARPSFSQAEQDRLYNFGLHVHYAFKSVGLINETRPLVLHATIANMRYKTQAKGGRTSKGRAWTHGKKRWDDGQVDIRDISRVFNEFRGDVHKAKAVLSKVELARDEEQESVEGDTEATEEKVDDRDQEEGTPEKEFIWCSNIRIDRVAICKMGATKMDDKVWVEAYPPIAEKLIFER